MNEQDERYFVQRLANQVMQMIPEIRGLADAVKHCADTTQELRFKVADLVEEARIARRDGASASATLSLVRDGVEDLLHDQKKEHFAVRLFERFVAANRSTQILLTVLIALVALGGWLGHFLSIAEGH